MNPKPNRHLPAAAALAITLALPASAAADGSFFYEFCSGAVLRMTPLDASDGRAFQLDLRRGEGWSRYGEVSLDADGRFLTRQVDGRGATRYAPHNCEKVPGICEYTESLPDGTTRKRARINGREGETWTHSIFDITGGERELQVIGTVRYHEDGLAAEETWINTRSANLAEGCAKRSPNAP